MKLMDFWADLSMWNKYGLCAVGAAALFALLLFMFT